MFDKDDYSDQKEYQKALEEYNDILSALIAAHDYRNGFIPGDCERFNELTDFDPDWYDHNFGKRISTRMYCWLVGLKMAYEKYMEQNNL